MEMRCEKDMAGPMRLREDPPPQQAIASLIRNVDAPARNRNHSDSKEVSLQQVTSGRFRLTQVILAVATLSFAAVSLCACNTTAGLGQDVSATGQAVTKSADKVKQGL
jgi:predicted small secreted protein